MTFNSQHQSKINTPHQHPHQYTHQHPHQHPTSSQLPIPAAANYRPRPPPLHQPRIIAECGVCHVASRSPCCIAWLRGIVPHRTVPHPHMLEGRTASAATPTAANQGHVVLQAAAAKSDTWTGWSHGFTGRHGCGYYVRSRGASLRVRLTNLVRPRALGWRAEMRGIAGNAETWCSVGQRQPMAACARLVFLDVYARSIRRRQGAK